MALAQVDPRHGLALGQRGVDAHVEPFTIAHDLGEQAQLAAGAAALALEACARQAGLGHGAFDQFIADALDLVGDRLEKARPGLETRFAVAVEGRPGQLAGAFDLGLASGGEGRLECLAGGRVDGVEGLARGQNGFTSDELRAFYSHGHSFHG
ncbi:hypothetical protein A8U91_00501 [Halomonas elongata]|uniref:Uncharacterized protein n=1 Tax=Halomonas elongata TaxID=2746 RepID=A0A1B8P1P8_HALEL|nr:hypothetical protein A8U91_00501 [Halomonas elongata]